MEHGKKGLIARYAIGGVVVVVLVTGYFVGWFNHGAPGFGGQSGNTTGTVADGTVTSPTRAEVPANFVVPGQNATGTPSSVAVPKVVIPSAPGAVSNLRVFDVKADQGVFAPSTISAYVGDVIHINFTAVDKMYDITFPDYGMKQTAQKGETKVLEFQASNPGKFTYYCESCGGLSSNAKGYIVIVPKQ